MTTPSASSDIRCMKEMGGAVLSAVVLSLCRRIIFFRAVKAGVIPAIIWSPSVLVTTPIWMVETGSTGSPSSGSS